MTRKEKINQLNDIFAEINEDDNAVCYLTSEDNELIESAIKALEQESCSDAISRQAVLEALEQEEPLVWCDGADEIAARNQWLSDVDTIKNMPPVQTKPIECSDAISREQAVDAVTNLFEMSEYPHPYPQGKPIRLKDVKEKLKQLPSVQPKIRIGHWIPSHIPESILDECSECGFSCGAFTFNYCPNCGARMVKPQESEK